MPMSVFCGGRVWDRGDLSDDAATAGCAGPMRLTSWRPSWSVGGFTVGEHRVVARARPWTGLLSRSLPTGSGAGREGPVRREPSAQRSRTARPAGGPRTQGRPWRRPRGEALARTDPEAVEGARASVGLRAPARRLDRGCRGDRGGAPPGGAAARRLRGGSHARRRRGRDGGAPGPAGWTRPRHPGGRCPRQGQGRDPAPADSGRPAPAEPCAGARTSTTHGAAAAAIGYPVVVKPARLSAARGVSRADDPVDLEAAVTVAARATQQAGRGGDPILIEGLVEGPQVSAEILSRGRERLVLGFTDRLPPLGGFAERGGAFPAAFPMEAEARRVAAAALDAIRVSPTAPPMSRCAAGRTAPSSSKSTRGSPDSSCRSLSRSQRAWMSTMRSCGCMQAGRCRRLRRSRGWAPLRPVFAPRAGVLRAST